MRRRFALVLAFVLLAAGACRPAATAGGAIRVVDDAGDTISLAAPARRVVSLVPATTELLFAIGAGPAVVGRTTWCDYPPAAAAVPSLGDGINPNVEAILARRPDLVLLYNSAQNAVVAERLRGLGIAAARFNTDAFGDVPRLARAFGRLTGRERTADSLAFAFDTALAAATASATSAAAGAADTPAAPRAASTPTAPAPAAGAPPTARAPGATSPHTRPKVLLLVWEQPPMTIGRGSFLDELVARAGGVNLFADILSSSATVSIEAVAARDPDLILLASDGPAAFASRPEWQVVRAVRERRFVRVSGSAFNHPGPRSPAAIREMARRLTEALR